MYFELLLQAAEKRAEEGRVHKAGRAVCWEHRGHSGNTNGCVVQLCVCLCMSGRDICPGRMLLMPLTLCVREVGGCLWPTGCAGLEEGGATVRSNDIWNEREGGSSNY